MPARLDPGGAGAIVLAMKLTPGEPRDKDAAKAADTSAMTDQPGADLSTEREAELRRRLASGYYASASVLDRLAQQLAGILRRSD